MESSKTHGNKHRIVVSRDWEVEGNEKLFGGYRGSISEIEKVLEICYIRM